MIDPTTPQFAKFIAVYAEKLREAHDAYPEQYAWPLTELPQVVSRMAIEFADNGTANKDSPAIKATCKALGIKHTYRAIRAYLQGA